MRFFHAVLVLVILTAVSSAQFTQETESEQLAVNPKEITDATFQIVKSGTMKVTGGVSSINLTVAIPQSGIQSLKVDAEKWSYINDSYGNRLLLLEWGQRTADAKYSVDITVSNKAVFTGKKNIGYAAEQYLKPNSQVTFNDDIRKAAFPYERTFDRAVELAMFVHEYLTYDLNVVGELKPSDWVLKNRRGVCVEYANLLSSLLKISEIPTRYVVGYAYSSVEKKLIGHTWVEILADDGSWIPVDPTWNQAGYLDATHIATAYQENANQSEILKYVTAAGSMEWKRNDDVLKLLDYTEGSNVELFVDANSVSEGEKSYATVLIKSDTCRIDELTLNSCVAGAGRDMFEIYDRKKNVFSCGDRQLYWFFNTSSDLMDNFAYTCPVSLYDQVGNVASREVPVSGQGRAYSSVFITGPDLVKVNEPFTLSAVAEASEVSDYVFYNDDLGRHTGKTWDLKFSKEGTHTFYLQSGGGLAVKAVSVVAEKEFSARSVIDTNITQGSNFTLSVEITNLLNVTKTAAVSAEFQDQAKRATLDIAPGQAVVQNYTFEARAHGKSGIVVTVSGDTLSSYTYEIGVATLKKEEGGIIEAIIKFFEGIIKMLTGG